MGIQLSQSGPQSSSGLQLDKELMNSSVVHKNLGQEFIITTTDKLELYLRDHQESLKAKSDWKAPLALFLSFLATLVAADFNKNFLGISSQAWQAIFTGSCAFCFFWFAITAIRAVKEKDKGDIKKIIEKLKQNSKYRSGDTQPPI